MTVSTSTITLSINGVDRTSLLLHDSLYIRHTMENNASVCDFSMKDGGTAYVINGWHTVSVSVGGVVVFGGYIVNYDAVSIGVGATRQTNWHVSCKDWSAILDGSGSIITQKYTATADSAIVTQLFSTFLPTEGFDATTYVATINSDLDINFENVTIREALAQLASLVSATWYIAPDKTVRWNVTSGFASSAFNIDTAAPNNTTTFDVLYGTIQRKLDVSTVINKVSVVGGYVDSSTTYTDIFTGNGSSKTFGPFTKNIGTVWGIAYRTNSINTILYSSQIGYEPEDALTTSGGTYSALINLENGTVTFSTAPDNATSITIVYYYLVQVLTSASNSSSISAYGRTFEQRVYDESITSVDSATAYANRVLGQYSFARESVTFDVTKQGLLPGTLITISCSQLGVYSTGIDTGLTKEKDISAEYTDSSSFFLLEEDSGVLEQESYGANLVYLIQEVEIRPVVSQSGQFMVVTHVTCGDRQATILDAITSNNNLSAGSGIVPAKSNYGRVSSISNNLGEMNTGRAVFTDGGTAPFLWSNYNQHTGAVIGLEDINSNTFGAVYILDSGTVRAKVGRMTGLPNIGTITPTGWGIYTTNGYFQGQVVASTITGGIINGGTINSTVGSIGGFTIAANQIYSNGGTISTGSVVNSSNPGVLMGTAGLFGYGTIGLTFALYTDPARTPYFSSGTINNAVYEIYETAILRTNSDVFQNGGVQIDNSGIFGVNPLIGAGALLIENGDFLTTEDSRTIDFGGISFMLDATTGNLWAENAYISGTVNAVAGVFTGTVSASSIEGGSINAAIITGGNINGVTIAGNLLSGNRISAGSVTSAFISSGTISSAIITANTISGNNISGGTVTGVVVTANTLTGNSITGGTITGGLISGGTVTGTYITGPTINVASGTVVLDTHGIVFDGTVPFVGGSLNPTWIKWQNSGTTMGYIGVYKQTGNYTTKWAVGNYGVTDGLSSIEVSGVSDVSSLLQTPYRLTYTGALGDGWSPVTTFATNVTSDATYILKYRKFGDMIYVSGACSLSTGSIGPGVMIFQLPAGYRPINYNRIFQVCVNGAPVSGAFDTSGNFTLFGGLAFGVTLYVDGIVFFTT